MSRMRIPIFAAVFIFVGVVVWYVGFGHNPLEDCMKVPEGSRFGCFQKLVDSVADSGDYAAAFTLVARVYDRDVEFAANCHASTHEIGKKAYERLRRGESSTFSSKAYFCGYGFYHGFMEQLLAESGDVTEAQHFCDLLGEKLLSETADARGACYHGIGHGTVDGTDPRLWGSPRRLVEEGIKACERVAASLPDVPQGAGPLYRCTTGAYNSLEILSQNEKYGLKELAANPFGFCENEKLAYRAGCYTNMIIGVLRLHSDDFTLVISEIESIRGLNDRARASLVMDLFHEYIRLHLGEGLDAGTKALPLCKGLRDPLRISCIEGLSGGYLKYGLPMKEVDGLLYFCASNNLAPDEAAACWRYGLSRLRNFYSPQEVQTVCSLAPEPVRYHCGGRSPSKI